MGVGSSAGKGTSGWYGQVWQRSEHNAHEAWKQIS